MLISSQLFLDVTVKHSILSYNLKVHNVETMGLIYKMGVCTDLILKCVYAKIHVNFHIYKNGLWRGKVLGTTSGSQQTYTFFLNPRNMKGPYFTVLNEIWVDL